MSELNIYEIRSRYTTPDNRCKPEIGELAHIAIAHDIATLVHEIETLRSTNAKLQAEVRYHEDKSSDNSITGKS